MLYSYVVLAYSSQYLQNADSKSIFSTPSVHKRCNYVICVSQANSSLIKFIGINISIYISKLIYYKKYFI
jgi:hypothetical protein